ncbi:4Fe-4S binding protein [Faecalicatena contorta]|uniref:ATP-binding protein n=1 Tax=Faecalicatena contorta TaxID=39482 RepID=UPI001F2A82D3|nr:4Fe-4S binding protein [Faecalicatena contorta]MCF2681328.1 4Fe-4S binding protein [Faecalicatena contorta]
MIRKIIHINEEKCNGCGACAAACHEGAIAMIDGKARLIRDDYCDGLGDCLPACPTNAISFEEREALAYDEEAVQKHLKMKKMIAEMQEPEPVEFTGHLSQWPVQIKLVPTNAPYFENANLLIAADCTAFAYGDFHNRFIKNHITLIGCPKLDEGDYTEKLTEIISQNNIKSLTIVRMEVPCCGGIERAAKEALKASGKFIPWHVTTIGVNGNIKE